MNIAEVLIRLRNDLREWVTNNILELKESIPSTDGLATEEYVDEKLENMKGNCKVAYGTCSTEAATAEKAIVVEDSNWKLEIGSIIVIRFSVSNSASNVTLNVNGTGAYGIRAGTSSPYTDTSTNYTGYADRAYTYMFDGTYWQWISNGAYPSSTTNVSLGQGYATCSTAAATKAKTASLSSYALSTGGIVVVKFTNDVPAGATLNVNSKGAKEIYYKGAAITDGVIKAGDTATFIYSTRYHLISIDREIHTHEGESVYYLPANAFTTVTGSSTSGAYLSTKWTVTDMDGITVPYDGMTIAIRVPTAGVSTAGVVLSIDGGATYHPIVRNVNTVLSTYYSVGATIIVTYNSTQTATAYLTSNTKTTPAGVWQIADYDADTKTRSSNNAGKKMYIIGATTQSTSGQTTYSNSACYIGTDNSLYSNGLKVADADDLAFRDRTHTSLYPSGTKIPANADLNTIDYIKVGCYYCSANADAKTLVNCPITVAFMMEVLSPLSSTFDDETTKTYRYRIRRLTRYNTGEQYIQYVGSSGTAGVFTYGEWEKVALNSDIPTKTSQLTNDSDFITKHQGSENAGKILAVDNNGDIVFEEMPEGSGEGEAKSESLEFTYISSYPDQTTFEYTAITAPGNYWLYGKSTLSGGILSVDWDTALLTSVELILYLFDSDGNPYRYTQRYPSATPNTTIAGDKYTVIWMNPGTGSGFCIATGPFTIKIPDNCSVMLVLRGSNAVFPSGSSLNDDNFYKLASSVFSVSVIKEASVAFAKVNVIQGASNANRMMITNDKGEVVVGDINPNSMALRPNWDTVIHRGWVNGAKENTIPAFYLAKENGYSWVECDIRISSDGVPVLAHDDTITSEDGASVLTVAESTVSQLKSITLQNHERFGAIKMNTLAELLDMARCLGMKIVLDIKVSGESAMKSIAKTVLRYGMSDNVIYMPIGTTNASHIKMVDKNASFDFVMYGTNPTSATDLTGYASLLNGSNHVNLDIQANTWEFTSTVIDSINNVGLGLCAWNVMSENIGKCIDSGMLRITKHNDFDDVDLNTNYLKDKKFW